MQQECNECGKEIETGGFGGLPMKQHYKHKHPEKYFEDDKEQPNAGTRITQFIGE